MRSVRCRRSQWRDRLVTALLCVLLVHMKQTLFDNRNVRILNNSSTSSTVRFSAVESGQISTLPSANLTLFTTFKEKPERYSMHRATVENWASLMPYVQPILFAENTTGSLAYLAQEKGWIVKPIPEKNFFGTPYLKAMFHRAVALTNSTFYGYANGDILFNRGLQYTLMFLPKLEQKHNIYLSGARISYIIGDNETFVLNGSIDDLAKKGHLDSVMAVDYFIVNSTGYPWKEYPNLVIGRRGYDNYLMYLANKRNMCTIDATKTIRAIHLKGSNLKMTHRSDNNPDGMFNLYTSDLIPYGKGFLDSALFETRFYNHTMKIVPKINRIQSSNKL